MSARRSPPPGSLTRAAPSNEGHPPRAAKASAGPTNSSPPRKRAIDLATRNRVALAAALDPIITIDASGIVLSASDSVQRVLGWKPRELLGRNVSILMPEPHRSAHDGYLANYHRTGQTNILNRPRRFEALRKDGSLMPIELSVSRAELPGGGAPLFVGIIRDMSEYAAAERTREEERVRHQQLLAAQTTALQAAHLRLRMADRVAAIGTLAAGLGHDMNNVLLPVRTRLNALKAAGAAGLVPASERKHVDEIRKSVTYLQQLADGLHFLAMDPDASEKSHERRAETDLRQWWSQVGSLLSKAVPSHVRVSTVFPAQLPRVAVAAHRMTQAVLNMVVNAGEAIPKPSKRKRRQGLVNIWAESMTDVEGAWVRLGVTDNGLGMSGEVKRRAFEMFFTTKHRDLGTGLGLALVQKVAEQAGGKVEIGSEPGKGTTVLMCLPAAAPQGQPQIGGATRSAVISLKDGRAEALIRHFLEASGMLVRAGTDDAIAEVLVVDPTEVPLRRIKAWRAAQPRGSLVLVGEPRASSAAAWSVLRPLIIKDRSDLRDIRSVLGSATSRA